MYTYSRSAYFVYHILNNFAAQQKKPDFFPPTFLWIIPISLDVVNPPKYKESIFKMKIDNVSVTNSFSNLEWHNFQIKKIAQVSQCPKIFGRNWRKVFSCQGYTELAPWPWWCQVLAVLLILSSVLWIPGVALVKYYRLIDWKEEVPAYFPEDELMEERQFQPHISNQFEKVLFGFKD